MCIRSCHHGGVLDHGEPPSECNGATSAGPISHVGCTSGQDSLQELYESDALLNCVCDNIFSQITFKMQNIHQK